ncbi:splicing regulator SDE2 isoform X2 [Gouania willdenowi]|uniref:splicing regulator SDE2 isoform X2 n=1 Tax=Gouania willdenowi TaxID=441366 RepID=UPI001056086D|nr:replication stress response regulator SDE2 isoform X2 [Gouania willdenowi]
MFSTTEMEVSVNAPTLRLSCSTVRLNHGSTVRDVLDRFIHQQLPVEDFYVVCGGRRANAEQSLVDGAVYHLEPRLLGGKGGFGSMLRALGAQIEKTTNREACRDLSGRRLRDVNHEKEMADWLKQQSERESEREQRRAERLQRKLSEPKHLFNDPQYQKQCHDLAERMEESVLKGLQASSSSQVQVGGASKRASSDQSQPQKKKTRREGPASASWFWSGIDDLSDDDDDDDDDDETPSSSSSDAGVTTVGAEPRISCNATDTNENDTEQNKNATQQNNTDTEQNKNATQQNNKDTEQNKNATQQNNKDTEQNKNTMDMEEHTTQQNNTDTEQNENATEENKNATNTEEHTTQQNNTDTEQNKNTTDTEENTTCEPALLVSMATSAQQLEALGLDTLKAELKARGVKCGGTLTERAVRLFSVRGQKVNE